MQRSATPQMSSNIFMKDLPRYDMRRNAAKNGATGSRGTRETWGY